MRKRKILFPITSKIHYARQKLLLGLLKRHPQFELQLVLGGSVLVEKYADQFATAIARDGFAIRDTLYNVIDGGNHVSMAKSAGLTALELSNTIQRLNPDIVLVRADRFEQLAIAMVAAYLNKTIAHIEGGDVSGTIDESVRHAITKLAHIHFVTNEAARRRVIQMGENPQMVFDVGSTDIEFASSVRKKLDERFMRRIGTGHNVDFKKPFIMVIQHPVTTELNNREHMEMLLEAVDQLGVQAVWFWPNIDAGTNEMAKVIRVWRELGRIKNNRIKFVTDLLPEDFIALLKRTRCLVGNSSAGIKECSYFGIPVVTMGTRQANRLRGPNVRDVGYNKSQIREAIKTQFAHGPYSRSDIYYKPNTSRRIVEVLERIPLAAQKRFYEQAEAVV